MQTHQMPCNFTMKWETIFMLWLKKKSKAKSNRELESIQNNQCKMYCEQLVSINSCFDWQWNVSLCEAYLVHIFENKLLLFSILTEHQSECLRKVVRMNCRKLTSNSRGFGKICVCNRATNPFQNKKVDVSNSYEYLNSN